jgi:hypothetical protein
MIIESMVALIYGNKIRNATGVIKKTVYPI